MLNKAVKTTILAASFLTGASFFYLFTYNSGYGYDALEYLVIGRSLLDGYPLYSFITSKSWGMYYFTAAFLSLGNVSNHWGVSLLVTLIFSCMISLTFLIIRRVYNEKVAISSCLLTAICAVFMEMNFLETEGPVYIFGLLGFYWLVKAIRGGRLRDLFTGGLFIGIGFAFKSIAGFYFVAAALFFLTAGRAMGRAGLAQTAKKELCLLLGLCAAVIPPAIYFALSGRLMHHLEWSYYFPLWKYPMGLEWFYKLHTKLLWFLVLLVIVFTSSLAGELRRKIYADPVNRLVILMGLVSLLALIKTQASHYVFPGAAFLSIFIAVTWNEEMKSRVVVRNKGIAMAISLVLFMVFVISIYLYNYPALRRLVTIRDYSSDAKLKKALEERIPENKKGIFLYNSLPLYWLSGRYPNIPFVYFDVHSAYIVDKNPDILARALSDPDLVMVEFNPETLGAENRYFFEYKKNKAVMLEFSRILGKYFVRSDLDFPPHVFWERKRPDE